MDLRSGLRGTYFVFWREMKRFTNQRLRIMMSVVQPVVWLVLMGNMMTRLTDNPFTAEVLGVDNYLVFMVPGVMIMTSLFAGVYGGISIIWDRRLGFLVKLLSAPIPRYSIALGKMSALILQTMFQVSIIAVLGGLMGVRFVTGVGGIMAALLFCGLFSAIMSSISLFLSASVKTPETLFAIINFLTMPLVFTSNALFPTGAMPSWIQLISRFNPITYAVAPVRTLAVSGWDMEMILSGAGILLIMFLVLQGVVYFRFERGSLL